MKSLAAGLLIIAMLNSHTQAASTDTISASTPTVMPVVNIIVGESTKVFVPDARAIVELRITEKSAEKIQAKDHRHHSVQNMVTDSVCSGFFIDDMGDIITAGHCTEDAESIEAIVSGDQHYLAVVLATSSVHDLALLHIDKRNTVYIEPAEHVERGEQVFVLGSPLAISDILTTGIIARLGGDIILLDCGILPGNSGSAVVDRNGNLVGVVTAGYIVGLGVTHLNIAQSLDAVYFFVAQSFRRLTR